MNKQKKKGFTIVELVIVIAVIAILAAVLIPTFSGLIKKANLSADQQAVRQMNTALAVEGAVEKNNIFDVYDALGEMGMDAEDYKPLTEDTYFFWDADLDRVLHVDENKKVLYPAEYADLNYTGRTWISLNAKIATKAPEDYSASAATVTVDTPEEMAYVVEQIQSGKHNTNTLKITVDEDLDMMGANVMLTTAADGVVNKDITIEGNATIKNVTNIDAAYAGTGGDGNDGLYYAGGLFGKVKNGTVTIKGVTIENINIKNTHVSGAAVLVAQVEGTGKVVIEKVTIKDCTVIAHRNAGALVGNAYNGSVELKGDIVLDNVHVKTVGGRSGLVIGYLTEDDLTLGDDLSIKLQNGSSYSIYQCEQNTGTFDGEKLGLTGTTLKSYAYEKGEDALKEYQFFEGAYATKWVPKSSDISEQEKYTGFDGKVTVVG